jgi:hypothetical protein
MRTRDGSEGMKTEPRYRTIFDEDPSRLLRVKDRPTWIWAS